MRRKLPQCHFYKVKVLGYKRYHESFNPWGTIPQMNTNSTTINKLTKNITANVLHFFFPAVCPGCSGYLNYNETDRFCDNCYSEIKFIREPMLYCQKCGLPLPDGGAHCYNCIKGNRKLYFTKLRGVCVYDGTIKNIVHKLKYSNKPYLSRISGKLLNDYLNYDNELKSADVICSVPLHWWKKIIRGYNQAELIALEISKSLKKPYIMNNLIRKRYTKAQFSLNRDTRLKNVVDAFSVRQPEIFKDRSVLIIDDVCTTGETLNQCAKALKSAGASEIYGITLAREIYKAH